MSGKVDTSQNSEIRSNYVSLSVVLSMNRLRSWNLAYIHTSHFTSSTQKSSTCRGTVASDEIFGHEGAIM